MEIPKIIEKNKQAVVLVDVQIPVDATQKKIGIKGTGFVVSGDGRFVTNAHVYRQITAEEMPNAGVSVPGPTDEKGLVRYERYPFELLGIDDENDVALLKIKSGKKDFVAISGTDERIPKEGEEVAYIGYPLAVELLNMGFGLTMTTNRALVSSVKRRGVDASFHFFLIDGHINNGSSGSPVFSVESGKVIGIASAKISAKIQIPNGPIADIPANMGICRPIQYANNLMN